jgi:hypothetical protein
MCQLVTYSLLANVLSIFNTVTFSHTFIESRAQLLDEFKTAMPYATRTLEWPFGM